MPSKAELFSRLDEAMQNEDLDVVRKHIAEDVVFHLSGENQLSGDYEGRDAFLDLLTREGKSAEIDVADICRLAERASG